MFVGDLNVVVKLKGNALALRLKTHQIPNPAWSNKLEWKANTSCSL